MTEESMKLVAGISGAFIAYAAYVLAVYGRNPSYETKKKVALETLSAIWSKRKDVALTVVELSRLWRENNDSRRQRIPPPEYKRKEIRAFYMGRVEGSGFFAGAAGDVVRELLRLLDEEGDCPSVVSDQKDCDWKDYGGDRDVYKTLAAVPLYRHSLNVAERLIASVGHGPMMARSAITALAHDIGKLPGFKRSPIYSMGDHPIMSAAALEGIDAFRSLPYASQVVRAIKDHHRTPNRRDRLSIRLKEADHAARTAELSILTQLSRDDKSSGESIEKARPAPEKVEKDEITKKEASPAAVPVTAVTMPQVDTTPKPVRGANRRHKVDDEPPVVEVDIPWFDYDEFIREIRPVINRETDGLWTAFSMPNGVVYFQSEVLWQAAQRFARARGDMSLTAGAGDKVLRRNVLLSVVKKFREAGAIAEGLIGGNYFSQKFTLKMRKKEGGVIEYKPSYTPFNAEAFAKSVSELEADKNERGRVKRIFEVTPGWDDDGKE